MKPYDINYLKSTIETIEQLRTRLIEVATNNPQDVQTQVEIYKCINALLRVIGAEAQLMGSEE